MAITLTNKINNTVLDFVRGVPFQSLNKFEVNLSIADDDEGGEGDLKGAVDSGLSAVGASSLANIIASIADFASAEDDVTLNKIIRIGSSVLMQLYAQSITVSLPEIETGHLVNGVKYIKDIKIPEDIEISFLEDELGLTLRLIEYWKTKIIGYDNYVLYSDKATSRNFTGRTVRKGRKNYSATETKDSTISLRNYSGSTIDFFNEGYSLLTSKSQKKAKGIEYYKANLFIKPLGVQDESILFPAIKVKGAFPKSIDSFTFNHESQDFMIHKVRFSVDTVYVSKFV